MSMEPGPAVIHHEVRTDTEGRAVLVRWSTGEAGRARLAHTAAVLERARHPGVSELRSFSDDGERAELVVAWAASGTLADLGPLSVRELAGLVAALADTVADLHGIGVVHGAISADHVLVAADGRPVLCGFGDARLAGAGADPPRPSVDVADLGALLHLLLGTTDPPDPSPTRRGGRGRRPRDPAHLRRGLRTLADHASAEDASCRPSARALAAAITALVPDAVLPGGAMPARPGPDGRGSTGAASGRCGGDPSGDGGDRDDSGVDDLDRLRATMSEPARRLLPPRAGVLAATVMVLTAATAGAVALRGGSQGDPTAGSRSGFAANATATAGADDPGPDDPGDAPARTGPPATTARTPPSRPTPATTGRPTPVTEPVVEVAGRRYQVGEVGDVVVVGDWRCEGSPEAAVLRPTTGDVFLFDGWAAPGEQLAAPAVARIDSAVDLVAEAAAPGTCPTLTAVLADGRRRPVELAGS